MPRPVYFSGSISGGRADAALYLRIITHLKTTGHEISAEHVGSGALQAAGESLAANEIFQRDLEWIEEVSELGGVLVAEVSKPSIGVGYEIAVARHRFDMPVICLYRPAHTERCSAMIAGDDEIKLIEYQDESIEQMLEQLVEAIDGASE